MRQGIIILFILGLFACEQKSNSGSVNQELKEHFVADSIIYEFVNFILSPKDLNHFSFCNKIADQDVMLFQLSGEDSLIIANMDSVFTKDDLKFIYKQLNSMQDFRLNPRILRGRSIISADTLMALRKDKKGVIDFWEKFEKKFGRGGYCTITMPLFSKNKSTVIIKTGYHCGALCGNGGTYIYSKRNGMWILIETLDSWES